MNAEETLRFLEAHCQAVCRFDEFPPNSRYGVEIFDPIQHRTRYVYGATIRAAAMKAQEILEAKNGNQENNEAEAAN